ncbi:ATP-binding cassette domain-containing protein [Streptococcus catagoni]|uniref:ATP-binding cassette domain-containing protein n=1 Tax=Streptococcus catagoni TaxID=2654874 RepID=UPI001408126A|nr:ATP-binding cassette domain-containing protein [Streptococcus catagoni]
MLNIKDLTITHEKDLQLLIDHLTLSVHPGDKLAIIGEEGTGKSTFIKCLFDPDLIKSYSSIKGTISNHFGKSAYIGQALDSKTSQMILSDYLYEGRNMEYFDFNYFFQLANQLAFNCDLIDNPSLKVKDLSGGEQLKLQLLKKLAYHPDLVLLDEPSSDLDIYSIKWLENFIRRSELSFIFISHDESFLTKTATSILHLELLKRRSKAVYHYFKGDYPAYVDYRKKSFEKQSQLASKERKEFEKKKERFKKIHDGVEHQLRHTKDSTAGRLLAKKMKAVKSQERRLCKESEQVTEKPQAMDTINVFFSDIKPLAKQKILLNWTNHRLLSGQTATFLFKGQDKIFIRGRNGIGKSRLLEEIRQLLLNMPKISLGFMPQNYDDNLPLESSPIDYLSSHSREKVRSLLASFDFTKEEMNHAIAHLSGGQKAKLFLAKIILDKNNLILLDEPTRHFSPMSQPVIKRIISEYPGAILAVSHDRTFMASEDFITYELNSLTFQEISIDR